MKKLQFAALLVLTLSVCSLRAQVTSVPYYIYNSGSCDITVSYEMEDCNAGTFPCGGTAVVPAATGSGPGIATVACPVNPGDDIYVILTEIDYVNITGGTNMYAVTTPGGCWGGGYNSSNTNVAIPSAAIAQLQANGSFCGSATVYNIVSTGGYVKIGF